MLDLSDAHIYGGLALLAVGAGLFHIGLGVAVLGAGLLALGVVFALAPSTPATDEAE